MVFVFAPLFIISSSLECLQGGNITISDGISAFASVTPSVRLVFGVRFQDVVERNMEVCQHESSPRLTFYDMKVLQRRRGSQMWKFPDAEIFECRTFES